MKAAILGAGAMGSLFGLRLIQGGMADVYLLTYWQEHVDAINSGGIRLKTTKGIETAPARAYSSPEALLRDMGAPADLLIVFVKGYSTGETVKKALCLFGPETHYLTVQNGLGNAEAIAEAAGTDRIYFGRTTEGAAILEPGLIFFKSEGRQSVTNVMPYSGGVTPKLEAVADMLRRSGINTAVNMSTEEIIWEKVLMNCIGNSMAALLRMSTQSMMRCESGYAVARMIADEVLAVAKAKGVNLSRETADSVIDRLSRNDLQASTGRDVLNKRRTEIDTLNGAIARLGEKYGVPTPVNSAIFHMVNALQSNYDGVWQ